MSKRLLQAVYLAALLGSPLAGQTVLAQSFATSDRKLDLADNSPYRDPDLIYLEADELINDETAQVLTARGEVEGRYQDRTLRADQVVYSLNTGIVVATGNVVLVNSDGSSQYADKLELSNELEAGNAADFTSRTPGGGIMGAAFAAQRTDEGVDLYNAYYTACETCADKKNPTWQIKARRVTQDKDRNMIKYKDAVFELFGVPVLYTPFLAHPDPSADRASGFLSPFGGFSSSRGAFIEVPYYFELDDYSELTLTPHIFSKVNPLLGVEYRRKFHSGEINIDGSLTYASAFDKDGDPFTADDIFTKGPNRIPADGPIGKRLRSHFFADGQFEIAENWDWGFTAQGTSDDLYTRRYGLSGARKAGLYTPDSLRLISQLYALGQSDNFRVSASTYGFQSLRTNIQDDPLNIGDYRIGSEPDSALPIIAPKLEFSHYLTDPFVGGRLQTFGDFTMLTRKEGDDYRRGTAGLNWNKSFILPAGIEAKPFGEVRYDNFELTPYDATNDEDLNKIKFDRTLGQVGLDLRWPFINSSGNVDFILEPRAMITQNFGNTKTDRLRLDLNNDGDFRDMSEFDYLEDSLDIDLDHNLLWSPNKSTGYDLWQKGFRADIGGSVSALWGNNHASLFLGQSYTDNVEDVFEIESGLVSSVDVFDNVTGDPILDPDTGLQLTNSVNKSDLVGQFELGLSKNFTFDTRVRYDDDDNKFRRLDTGFRYNSERFRAGVRYYKVDKAIEIDEEVIPAEEISGSVGVNINKNWSVGYRARRDLDQDITRSQALTLAFRDDCTLIELTYNKYDYSGDVVRDTSSIGIRISLLTLGQFGGDNRSDNY